MKVRRWGVIRMSSDGVDPARNLGSVSLALMKPLISALAKAPRTAVKVAVGYLPACLVSLR